MNLLQPLRSGYYFPGLPGIQYGCWKGKWMEEEGAEFSDSEAVKCQGSISCARSKGLSSLVRRARESGPSSHAGELQLVVGVGASPGL